MQSRGDARILSTGASLRGAHRLQLAGECLQKYAWEVETPKELRTVERPGPALVKGKLLHLALGHHYVRMREQQQDGDPESWATPQDAVVLMAKLEGGEEFVSLILDTY